MQYQGLLICSFFFSLEHAVVSWDPLEWLLANPVGILELLHVVELLTLYLSSVKPHHVS
jgi:hypothetical protein